MATDVLRPHNVLLPPQRIRAGHQRQRPSQGAAATRKPAVGAPGRSRQQQGGGRGSSAAKKAAPRQLAAVEVYAGPAYSVSPEPSSLPLPQFPSRKAVDAAVAAAVAVDDAATRDLRRMLRLE